MSSVDRIWPVLRARPLVADAVLAVGAALLALAPMLLQLPEERATPVVATVIGAVSCLALVGRRRWPFAVFALALAGTVVATVVSQGTPLLPVALGIALYSISVQVDRRIAVMVLLATIAILGVTIVLTTPTAVVADAIVGMFAQTGMFTAVGYAVRSRRAYVAAIEDRAVRAERTREEEARRRVAEERLRIARELHDVVAHHVAIVSVQAGLAAHLMTSQPEAAREALGHVRRASAAILDDLGGIVGVLRRPDEGDGASGGTRPDGAPDAPAAGLAQLDELIESFARTGLRVDRSVTGEATTLPGTVDLIAYRVLQEALTNAHKHGGGTARVEVAYLPSAVTLTVSNPIRQGTGPGAGGTGFGLIGMRERAMAVGGAVRTGADGEGWFRVRATLPIQSAPDGAEPR